MFLEAILFLLFCGVLEINSHNPIVETNVGTFRGISAEDGDYDMFLGVPFGKINESNPFGVSTPYPKFDEIYSAFDDNAECPQISSNGEISGSLDCLQMNIYVPHNASRSNPLPVYVYLHGGFLRYGNKSRNWLNPRLLVKQDIIFVALNYRVGLYGFMCLRTPEVPGNQGIKDQVLGLRWVRDNIGFFGGDAERTTLGGESAGSRSVDIHLVSPYEQLFQNAIMQSGTTLNANWFPEPDLESPIKLAAFMGFDVNDNMNAIEFLSTLNPLDILHRSRSIYETFKPCIETQLDGIEIVLKDHPLHLDVPIAKNISILTGSGSQERMYIYVNRPQTFYDNLDLFRTKLLDRFEFDEETLNEVEIIVKNFYIGGANESDRVWLQLADFDSDLSYFHDATRNVRKPVENGAKSVYYYVFDYVGNRNCRRKDISVPFDIGGTAHCDERGYLFDIENVTTSAEDQVMVDRMTTLWTNFIKYGDPTPETTLLLPVKWEPVRKTFPLCFMNLTYDMNLDSQPFHQRLGFLDLIYKLYGHYEKGFTRQQ